MNDKAVSQFSQKECEHNQEVQMIDATSSPIVFVRQGCKMVLFYFGVGSMNDEMLFHLPVTAFVSTEEEECIYTFGR